MNIDERGRLAATDLLERASAQGVPTLEDLAAPAARRRLLMMAGAAAAVLLAAVGIVATRPDDSVRTVTTVPAPPGVEAKQWSPKGLGVTMTVPKTWEERGPVAGFRYWIGEPNRDGYVLADRLRNVRGLDTDAVGSRRAADLQTFGATGISTTAVELGGRRAVELRYRLQAAGAEAAVTEYDIAEGDWFFLVVVGEQEPVDRPEITRWVASTIELRPLDGADLSFSDPLQQPDAALPVPAGIHAKGWAPEGLGVTAQVPATWEDMATNPAGFDHAIQPLGGGPTVMASRIRSDEAAGREAYLKSIGVVIESTVSTTVDGHPARGIRYWIAAPDHPLRVSLDVEYVIDIGSGNALIVTTVENDGGDDNSELLRWVRSTIKIP